MWTRKEMAHILGPRLPYTLGGRLSCTDAMDPDQYASLGMLNEMGTLVDAELARRGRPPVLKVEGVLTTDTPQKLAAIDAGLITPVREMHLDLLVSQRADLERRLGEPVESSGMTYGEHVSGILNIIDYGKVLYRFDRYRLSREVTRDTLIRDVTTYLGHLILKQGATELYRAFLGANGALVVNMVSVARRASEAAHSLTELTDVVAVFGPCQAYQDIRDHSPYKTHAAAWEYLKQEYGHLVRPYQRTPSEERRLQDKCEFAYYAFTMAQREGDEKQDLKRLLMDRGRSIATAPRNEAAVREPASVMRGLAGRWGGVTSAGRGFIWTIEESGRYEAVYREAGRDVRRGGRISVDSDGLIHWRADSGQSGTLSESTAAAGGRVLQGTIRGRQETFRVTQAEASSSEAPALPVETASESSASKTSVRFFEDLGSGYMKTCKVRSISVGVSVPEETALADDSTARSFLEVGRKYALSQCPQGMNYVTVYVMKGTLPKRASTPPGGAVVGYYVWRDGDLVFDSNKGTYAVENHIWKRKVAADEEEDDRRQRAKAKEEAEKEAESFKLDLNLEQMSAEQKVRLFVEAVRAGRFDRVFQLMGVYRSGIFGIMNSNPRVFWESKIAAAYSRALARYKHPPEQGWLGMDTEGVIKKYGNLWRPANNWRIMEVRKESLASIAYVKFEYTDRGSAPRLPPAKGKYRDNELLPVRIAWYTIYVDNATGTIGNIADSNPTSFLEDVSEFWK